MTRFVTLLLLFLLAASTTHVQAQEPAQPPQMKKLAFLVGKFAGKTRYFRPNQPADDRMEAVEGKWIVRGDAVARDIREEDAQMSFDVFTYDLAEKEYRRIVFAPQSGGPAEWSGNLEGDRLVLYSRPQKTVGLAVGLQLNDDRQSYRITRVTAGSDAEKAGLRVGDTVTHLDGQAALERFKSGVLFPIGEPGTPVRLTVRRDGKADEVVLTRIVRQLEKGFSRHTWTPIPGGGYTHLFEIRREEEYRKTAEVTYTPRN